MVLLDNGRTRLLADAEQRDALHCIRCGACLNECPVYQAIGGHAYGTTYSGPIGSVITPHLRGAADWSHLPSRPQPKIALAVAGAVAGKTVHPGPGVAGGARAKFSRVVEPTRKREQRPTATRSSGRG